jgi:hypothetical protein
VNKIFKVWWGKFAPGKFQAIFNLIDNRGKSKVLQDFFPPHEQSGKLNRDLRDRPRNRLDPKTGFLPLRWIGFAKLRISRSAERWGDNGVARKRSERWEVARRLQLTTKDSIKVSQDSKRKTENVEPRQLILGDLNRDWKGFVLDYILKVLFSS